MAEAAFRWNALFVILAPLVSLSACANILGFQGFVTSGDDAGDAVAQVPDTSLDTSANVLDGSASSPDAREAASDAAGIFMDSTAADGGNSRDASMADAGGTCTVGGNCTPSNPCYQGSNACVNGGAVCSATTPLSDGTPCGSTPGFVCKSGSCVACDAGADCSDPSMPCVKKTYDCQTGTAVCSPAGNAVDGTSCNGTMYCYSGACSACTVNASCAPVGQPCHVGKVTSCAGGTMVCTDQNTPAAAGVACQSGSIASGVCDGQGTCVACTPNAPCSPTNMPCKGGAMSCSTGAVCNPTSNINEGLTCGSGTICVSGSCVACNATTCANGCCNSTGCIGASAQTTSMCGTGTSGGTCQACTPANATAGCNGSSCTIQSCNTNYADCNGLAGDGCEANLMTSTSNCGSCGNACPTGGTCSGGSCSCPSGETNCNGACANLQTDSNNCGRCSHPCVHSTCSSGKCPTWTVAASPTANKPQALVSDGSNVIWADTGAMAVIQVPAGGGTSTTLASDASFQNIPLAVFNPIAIGSGYVTWIASTSSTTTNVVWMAKVGGTGAKLPFTFPAGNGLYNLAMNASATHVTVMNQYNGSSGPIYDFYDCTPLNSSETCTDISTASSPLPFLQQGAVANASTVYFADQSGSGFIHAFNFGAGSTTTLVTNATPVGGIAIDSNNVYWNTNTQIVKAPLVGGSITPIAALPSGASFVQGLATDGTNVYFTTNGTPPQVLYAAVSGCCTSSTSCCTATAMTQATNPTGITAPPGSGMIFWIDGSTITGSAVP